VSGAPNGDAGPTGTESSAAAPGDESSALEERIRLLKAAALGFALGLLLARWGAPSSS
jgi:hypothetical protein